MKNKYFIAVFILVILAGFGIFSISYVLSAGNNSGKSLTSQDSIMQGNSNSGVTPVEVNPVQVNPCDSGKCGSCCCKKQCGKEKCNNENHKKGKCKNVGVDVPIGKNPNLNNDTSVNNSVPQKDK